MRGTARTPERRRLRRLRWRSTVLFALATTLCLVVLAAMASAIDTRSHQRETIRELGSIAEQLARTAETTSGGLRFAPKGVQAWTSVQATFAYVDQDGVIVASPSQRALPSSATLAALQRRAQRTTEQVTEDAPAAAGGGPYHWLAVAVPYSDTTVIAGASAAPTPAHRMLDVLLALTVLALAVLGTALGHLLSGLAMRPALRGIEQHERFLREAAHELRTPLAVLQLAVDALPDRDDVSTISGHVQRMSGLVARLLERARLRGADRSAFAIEPIRLDQVVELTVEDVDGATAVALDLAPVVVHANAGLVAQAVRNLVENALRHGAAPVLVEVRGHEVVVSDSGPGVPAAARRRLLHDAPASERGTGTGLSIVTWVADIHRATLTLSDHAPRGLRVSLRFAHQR